MILDPQLMRSGEYNRFYKSVQYVLDKEGGYVNDPADPGGETNFGIAKRYHPAVDIKNLTPEKAADIYYNEYWVPSRACEREFPACIAVLDTAVNCGVSRALSFGGDPFDVDSLLTNRTMFYIQQVKKAPEKQKFLGGWTARVNDLKKLLATSQSTT